MFSVSHTVGPGGKYGSGMVTIGWVFLERKIILRVLTVILIKFDLELFFLMLLNARQSHRHRDQLVTSWQPLVTEVKCVFPHQLWSGC